MRTFFWEHRLDHFFAHKSKRMGYSMALVEPLTTIVPRVVSDFWPFSDFSLTALASMCCLLTACRRSIASTLERASSSRHTPIFGSGRASYDA